MDINNIVILGGNHHNTLGVIRALGQEGLSSKIKLVVVNDTSDFVSKSKYIAKDNYRLVQDETEIEDALNSFKYNEGKRVVICCSDILSSYVDKNYNTLCRKFVLPNANKRQGEITYLMNKDVQMYYAENIGLNVPISHTISKENISNIEWNIYPCIVKPLDSIIGGKADIHICYNRKELVNNITASLCTDFQIQEYIDKVFEFQLIGCSLGGGRSIIIPGFTRMIRQPQNTNTGYLKYSHYSKLDFDYSIAERFIRKIGYSGLFSMEFIRGKNGKDYFMEINMRNDGNAYCVTKFGVNLPLIWYKYSIGDFYSVPQIDAKHFILFMPELNDVKNIRDVGFIKWLKECIYADCHATFRLNDPYPFFHQLISMVRGKIKRFFDKK